MPSIASTWDAPQSVPVRDQFAPVKAVFIAAMHLGIIAVCWQTNWAAIGVCIFLHAVCGGLGICVGFHRLLTHRSFKCSKAVEYALAFLGEPPSRSARPPARARVFSGAT